VSGERNKPLIPIRPSGMDLLFFYPCPFCRREVPTISPTKATVIRCDACRKEFPIMPVDERSVRFVKIMLAGGRAAIDPDFA
jgi:DNA-directed RNA polymerase subunit RPC12/RpoP